MTGKREMILSKIVYRGNYELQVITQTREGGRWLITEYIRNQGLDLTYYNTIAEFVEDGLVQETLVEGVVNIT